MKIRLYRGPANGKVMYVEDKITSLEVEALVKPKKRKKKDTNYNMVYNNPSLTGSWSFVGPTTLATNTTYFATTGAPVYLRPFDDIPGSLDIERVTYLRTSCYHPDGSVFFEWSKPRKK